MIGCSGEIPNEESEGGIALIELRYTGGQISPEFLPKLQIREGNTALFVKAAQSKVIALNQKQIDTLLTKVRQSNFLALDSESLQKKTLDLIKQQDGPKDLILDASAPKIRVWTGDDYHEVTFYAPRHYLRLSGENPDLALFVEVLDELEKIAAMFSNN